MHNTDQSHSEKKHELFLFLFLTIILAPAISVAAIGGYGFFIWISQMLS
jgi:nitrate reductase NapE